MFPYAARRFAGQNGTLHSDPAFIPDTPLGRNGGRMHLTRETTLVPNVLLQGQLPRRWSAAAVVGALVLIFVLDRSTGSSPFQHLYYLPIIFASMQFGYPGSLGVAATAVVLYHLANPHVLSFRYEELDVVQVALFIAVGLASARVAQDARRLHRLAMTDDLTGLHNLRSFEARLRTLVSTSLADGTPLAMLVLDVDRLKSLNDAYGHLAGAEAVQAVGQVIAARLPGEAVACRYGGDEFVIALPECGEVEAAAFANSLRRAVHERAPVLAGVPFPTGTLSVSIGIAARQPGSRSGLTVVEHRDAAGEALFRAADAALYAAKRAGRNRVSITA